MGPRTGGGPGTVCRRVLAQAVSVRNSALLSR